MAGERQSQPALDPLSLLLDMRTDMREGFSTLHERADKTDGKIDKIDSKLDQHARDDLAMGSGLRREIGEVRDKHSDTRERVKALEAHEERDAEQRFANANGTGKFATLPEMGGGSVVVQTPGIGMPVHVDIGRKSNSQAPLPKWIARVLQEAFSKKVLYPVAAAVIGAATHYVLQPGPQTKIVTIPTPSQMPPEPTTTPAVPTAMATMSATVVFVDAGAVVSRHPR